MARVNRKRLDEIRQNIEFLAHAVTFSEGKLIADTIKNRMLSMISKGLSPIEGAGRFPEYLAAGRKSATATQNRQLKAKARIAASIAKRASKSGLRARSRTFRHRAASFRSTARASQRGLFNSYPFNVLKDFPNKRLRPVNLFLSGKFLKSLQSVFRANTITLRFNTKLSKDKELGHREGANGQPKRPILPDLDAGEHFNISIMREVLALFSDILTNAVKRGKI